jgi:hypothetical protein
MILLAAVALVVLSPFIFATLLVGFALTVGVLGWLIKVGAVLAVIWAVVMLGKKLFGSSHPAPRLPVHQAARAHVDPEAQMERERRESLAALDRELALAIARKDAEPQ